MSKHCSIVWRVATVFEAEGSTEIKLSTQHETRRPPEGVMKAFGKIIGKALLIVSRTGMGASAFASLEPEKTPRVRGLSGTTHPPVFSDVVGKVKSQMMAPMYSGSIYVYFELYI